MRVAGIDCGTNSIRLLIADVDQQGKLHDIERLMKVVRLGEDVDKTGRLAPQALERTFTALDEYVALIRQHGVKHTLFVATSASRDAENAGEFIAGVERRLGVGPRVISGDQEAAFSFTGAMAGVPATAPRPVLVVDIGGGSTEFAIGSKSVEASISVDMGCVRVTERFLRSGAEDEAHQYVNQLLDDADRVVDFSKVGTLVGVAGSVTTITAHALGLKRYDPAAIDGAALTVEQIHASTEALRFASSAEKAQMLFMHPGRRDVIGAGSLIWEMIVDRVSAEVSQAGRQLGKIITSEHDILDGITLGAAAEAAQQGR
ncbi:Ppx/GppA phosphatase family protein [Boudabousia marimammalium]|uniref:Exopolyphosphatase n=1 Tax=Boudabousia marimammalium TaxID=156892 RepID=A0A1Q5PS64_9ACTO|nr:exopolyphosphatase [Boudabousia marimammalium]